MPLVSAVIPTRNRASMLDEALESVMAQTYQDFEVIVIDDGSTDQTRRVVARRGDRVRYIYQEQQGPSSARNTGIKAARGSYVAFLDDDDIWLPRKLALQVSVLEDDPGVDLVYGTAYQLRREGARALICTHDPPDAKWSVERLLLYNYVGSPTVVVIRRTALEQAGGFDSSLEPCEDLDLWLRLASLRCQFAHVRAPIAEHRLHSGNWSYDLKRVHRAFFAIVDKVLTSSEFAHFMRGRRRYYLSRAWGRVGNDWYINLQIGEAWEAWGKAVRIDPSVLTPNLLFLMAKSLCGARALRWARQVKDALMHGGVH